MVGFRERFIYANNGLEDKRKNGSIPMNAIWLFNLFFPVHSEVFQRWEFKNGPLDVFSCYILGKVCFQLPFISQLAITLCFSKGKEDHEQEIRRFGISIKAFVLPSNHRRKLPKHHQLNLELHLVIYDVGVHQQQSIRPLPKSANVQRRNWKATQEHHEPALKPLGDVTHVGSVTYCKPPSIPRSLFHFLREELLLTEEQRQQRLRLSHFQKFEANPQSFTERVTELLGDRHVKQKIPNVVLTSP